MRVFSGNTCDFVNRQSEGDGDNITLFFTDWPRATDKKPWFTYKP